MATIEKNGAFMALPMNIKRGNPIPVDTTLVWYSKSELEAYAKSGATAYVGQIVTLVNEASNTADVYMISNTAGTLVKLAQTAASGNLVQDVTNLQNQVNTLITKVGSEASGNTPATGLFAKIANLIAADTALDGRLDVLEGPATQAGSVAEAKKAGTDAQTAVNNLKNVVGADDTAGLRLRIKTNETGISSLKTRATNVETRATNLEALHASGTHNGKATVAEEVSAGITALNLGSTYAAKSYEKKVDTLVGSDSSKSARAIAAEEVAKIVASADASYDTLKEIADWILSDTSGAAKMAADIKTNADDIAALETLVGSKAVATQISDAITAALKVSGVDKYALATDLTNLANTVGADDTKGLRKRIKDNETAIAAINNTSTGILKQAKDYTDTKNTAMDGRVKALETAKHTHSNKTVLDGITSSKVSAWDAAEQNAKTYADSQDSAKIGDLGKVSEASGAANHTVKSYVDAKAAALTSSISAVNNKVDALGSLASKSEVAESDLATALATKINNKADKATTLAGYGITNAYTKTEVDNKFSEAATNTSNLVSTSVNNAKTALIGDTSSTKDSNTIEGAKRYADNKAATAESNAKTYADNLVKDGSAIDNRIDALESKHASGKTVAQEVSDGITKLNLPNTYAPKQATADHIASTTVHITAAERTKWNAVTNKVDKTTTVAGIDLQNNITEEELRTSLGVEKLHFFDWPYAPTITSPGDTVTEEELNEWKAHKQELFTELRTAYLAGERLVCRTKQGIAVGGISANNRLMNFVTFDTSNFDVSAEATFVTTYVYSLWINLNRYTEKSFQETTVESVPYEALAQAINGTAGNWGSYFTPVPTQINDAIAALDGTVTGTGNFVKSISQTDGKITATLGGISASDVPTLDQSKISGLTNALAGKQNTVAWQSNNYDPSTNKAITKSDLDAAVAGLAGAVHFIGVLDSSKANFSAALTAYKTAHTSYSESVGDVVIYKTTEYIYADGAWHELGDEGRYAVKGSIVNADIANNAAIAQSKIANLTTDLGKKVNTTDYNTKVQSLESADTALGNRIAKFEADGANDVAALKGRVSTLEGKPAAGITANQITSWDNTVTNLDSTITNKINALDYSDKAVTNQYVSSVTQTDGKIAVTRVSLPTATASALGMVKVDNTSIGVTNGTISVKAVNVNKLFVADGDELVFDGGNA